MDFSKNEKTFNLKYKKCSKCRKDLLYEFFYKNKSKKDGCESYCKSCAKKRRRKKRAEQVAKEDVFEIFFSLPDEKVFIEKLKPFIEEIVND